MEQTKFIITYIDTGTREEYGLVEYSLQFIGSMVTIFMKTGEKNEKGQEILAPYLSFPISRIETIRYA